MHCPRCRHDNRAGAKFCEHCAAPLQRNCTACGCPLPESAKFCPECAQPVPFAAPLRDDTAADPAAVSQLSPTAPAPGERRQATVLSADISGYSALCGRLDAEQVQALLAHFYDISDRIVANYGGHVIDHAGDATLAVFGAPVAHDNDAERAVRAALDMQAQASLIVEPGGRALTLHIGIASGEVVAGTIATGAQPKYGVTGDAVNLAARVNGVAQSGQTIVTDAVYRAIARAFAASTLGEVKVKGFDKPVTLWQIIGVHRARAEGSRFIGRQAELRQLTGALEAVAESSRGSAVVLRGDAGIGKSRLVDEVKQRAQQLGFACHTGHILDFGLGKGQDAMPAILKGLLETHPTADESSVQTAVQRALAGGLLDADSEPLVNDMLELTQTPAARTILDAMDNATRVRRLGEMLVATVQRCSVERPRLLVVEDLHWASPTLLRYLALLTRTASESRTVLLMTTRVDGDPLDKQWRASTHGSPLMTVDLGPLRSDEAQLLATGLMESSSRLALSCVERAEGNPLFLEQLLRNAVESEASNLPASIQSLVLARMDRLGARDKTALQCASVLGKHFDLETLRFVCDDSNYRVDALTAVDLVRPEGGSYVFAHALIQEGVYSSLLNSKKRELHRRAADWYGERELILRATHLGRAADSQAAAAYLAAARDEANKLHHEKALELTDEGIATATDGAVRCSLLLLRGDLLREAGRSSESLAAFQQALELAGDDDRRYLAYMGIVAGHRVTSDIPAAMAASNEAQAIAERLGSAERRSRVHHVRGNLYFAAGDALACRTQHEAALKHAQQAGDAECEAQALSGLGDAQYLQGRMLTGLDYFRSCVELCERAGLVKVLPPNRCMVGHCLYYANRVQESTAQVRRSLEEARRNGQVQTEIFALESLGLLLMTSGDYEAAKQAVDTGIPLARAAGARRYLSGMLYSLGVIELGQGARDEARKHLDAALGLMRHTGVAFVGAAVFSAYALWHDDAAQARLALEQGLQMLRGQYNLSHSHLHFYRNAIDASLRWRDPQAALQYAADLADYVQAQPLPWTTFVIERAQALAAVQSGRQTDMAFQELRALRAQAQEVGLPWAIPAIDLALEKA